MDLSRTKAALGTQASTEVMVKVDLEWMDSPDYKTSQVIIPQNEDKDVFSVRWVWDPGIANPYCEAVLALIAWTSLRLRALPTLNPPFSHPFMSKGCHTVKVASLSGSVTSADHSGNSDFPT